MVGEFSDAIRALEAMRADGVFSDYALGGAVAFVIWDEPIATQDLDVVIIGRRERTARLIEAGHVTREEIDALVTRFRP